MIGTDPGSLRNVYFLLTMSLEFAAINLDTRCDNMGFDVVVSLVVSLVVLPTS